MTVHVLSGQWPFPGEAVRINPRNPNDPNDLVGVTEFDRREEHINLIGNEHPLMTLIQGCLSNSPSHRPTSSEVHQRVSAVAADHPPSFTNRVDMMDRIKTLCEERERERSEKENAIAQKEASIAEKDRVRAELTETQSNIDSLRQAHTIEVESLQIENTDLKADIDHLHATIMVKEKECKSDKEELIQQYDKRLEMIKKEKQAMEEHYLSDRRALEDEYHTVKQAMERQHQAQLESKLSELSAKDSLISSKSRTIQSLQQKLGQALGTSPNKDYLSVFSPGVKLNITECANVPV